MVEANQHVRVIIDRIVNWKDYIKIYYKKIKNYLFQSIINCKIDLKIFDSKLIKEDLC